MSLMGEAPPAPRWYGRARGGLGGKRWRRNRKCVWGVKGVGGSVTRFVRLGVASDSGCRARLGSKINQYICAPMCAFLGRPWAGARRRHCLQSRVAYPRPCARSVARRADPGPHARRLRQGATAVVDFVDRLVCLHLPIHPSLADHIRTLCARRGRLHAPAAWVSPWEESTRPLGALVALARDRLGPSGGRSSLAPP